MEIFERLGLEPIINASGAVTRLGGAPMSPLVLEAFSAAASESVPLEQVARGGITGDCRGDGGGGGTGHGGGGGGADAGGGGDLDRV